MDTAIVPTKTLVGAFYERDHASITLDNLSHLTNEWDLFCYLAFAVAEAGRQGEVRYLGEFTNTPDAVVKMVRKLADRYETLHFCYEAGPTGYGLYRQILALGHGCTVAAPSLIPRRPGERVKTNRR